MIMIKNRKVFTLKFFLKWENLESSVYASQRSMGEQGLIISL